MRNQWAGVFARRRQCGRRCTRTGSYFSSGPNNTPAGISGSPANWCATEIQGHGILFLGTEGWVHVDRSGLDAEPKSHLKAKLGANDTRLFKSDNHHDNFVDAVKGRCQPVSPIDLSVRSDTIAWLDQIAIKLGRTLRWEPAKEDLADDAEASAMLDRPLRPPWRLS